MPKSISKIIYSLSAVALLFVSSIAAQKSDDLEVEDIISKHLNSIGTKEKRDEVKSRMATGTSEFESKLPTRKTTGKAAIVSDQKNLMFITSFASREYAFEKIGFFVDKVVLPQMSAGSRSPLGAFLNDHKTMLSEGLLTGSISSTWNLLNPLFGKAKLTSGGTKKVNGRKAYVLSYPTNSGEFSIRLYFDAETFQHLRSEYRHAIGAKPATFGVLGTYGGVEIALIEDFGNFKTQDGLTLPHSYKMKYTTSSSSGTYEYDWGVAISQYVFNQRFADDFFSFDEK